MKRYPILEVCARIEGHAVQHQMLRDYCREFEDWHNLLKQAELEGMAPLLRKHLIESGSDCPASVRRSLNILYKRHQKMAEVRLRVLLEALTLFQQQQLMPILLKGAALCQTLYPDPALRPMRDIDILFRKEEVDRAQKLLQGIGFEQSTAPIPLDHHHLSSLYKRVDDVQVCIELHRGLYPNCPPYYPEVDFENLLVTGITFKIGGISVLIFSHEEMLHYLYQHGFRTPLTYETYKLVNVADIISFTEKYFQEIDWEQVKYQYPLLYRALPLMHHVAPWSFDKISENFISTRQRQLQLCPIPFCGWPQKRVRELEKNVTLGSVFKSSFLPTSWWLKVYYGTGYSLTRFIKAICFDHLKNVFWWIHVYSHFVIETESAPVKTDRSFVGSVRLFFISNNNKVRGVLVKLTSLLNVSNSRDDRKR